LLGLFFDPEDGSELTLGPEGGGDMFLQNVGSLSADYTALYLRRCNSSN
jgi:hypothetical protein